MSHAPLSAALPPDFESTLNSALDAYKKRTKQDLTSHPLLPSLQACNSPNDVLAVFQDHIPMLDGSHNGDEKLIKCLVPTVNVLYRIWATLGGEDAGMAVSPARLIFAGIGVLLLAANDADASQERLLDLFDRIGSFFKRLEAHMEVPPTAAMMDISIKIMTELLSVLAITTAEMKRGKMGKYVKKLMRKTEIEDSLERLDKLTQVQSRMASAELRKIRHSVDSRMMRADSGMPIAENVGNIGHGFQDGGDEGVQDIRYSAQSVEDRTQFPQRTDEGVQMFSSGGMEGFGPNVQGTQEGFEGVDERVHDLHDMTRGVDDGIQGMHIDEGMQGVGRGVEDIGNNSRGIQAKAERTNDSKRRKGRRHTVQEPSQDPRSLSSAPMPYPSPPRPSRARGSSDPNRGMGHPSQGHPSQGYPSQGYPSQGHPSQGHPSQGHPSQGYPSQGHPSQGYPSQGHPSQGHPSQGYPSQGYPSQGYPSHGNPSRGHNLEPYPLQASRDVKFRLRGSRDSGVSLNEILNGARISQSTGYSLRDLTPDSSGKISLKVRWAGYHSNTYEVPLTADSFGNVDLPSLGRRTGRAILHFMEQNKITLSGDRVIIHRLENSSNGIWVPVMATH